MPEYTIHGSDEGAKRLSILSRTLATSTERFLHWAGLSTGLTVLDLGCGAGDVTLVMSERVGPQGQLTGLDLDERKIQLATAAAAQREIQNVQFKAFNAYDLVDESSYDLVYSRFLLSHLNKPETVLQNIRHALKAGGRLLIEDTDFSGHFSYPVSGDFNRYVSLYQSLLTKRGADANFGQRLVGVLQAAGFTDVAFQIIQPAFLAGEGKLMAEITFEGISNALLEEGLVSPEEVQQILTGLVQFRQRNDSIMSLPRIFQVSGRLAE